MSNQALIQDVLKASPQGVDAGTKTTARVLAALGVIGAGIGFFAGDASAGWLALHLCTVLAIGLAVSGAVLSAIFELTGSKWGRAYRRLAEGSIVLMPLGALGAIVVLAGAGGFIPWLHGQAGVHLTGAKAAWLSRGFWSVRVLLALAAAYGVSLWFVYHSIRRDFCVAGVGVRFTGRLAAFVSKGIADPSVEAEHCSRLLAALAPVVCIVYAVAFTLLGFDLIMALAPAWYSTLFGAWYFIGHLFAGLAILAVIGIRLGRNPGVSAYLTPRRQADLATLLFAFTLINMDFFWSQFLTIWYGNLPEEIGYVVTRARDPDLPWTPISWAAITGFFLIPFCALIFRRVKNSAALLTSVALTVIAGIFLVRFIEVAPPILQIGKGWGLTEVIRPVAVTLLVAGGFAGVGWHWYMSFLAQVPIMPVGDGVFVREFGEGHDA